MTDITVTREDGEGRKGRYVARVDGIAAEGEITITRRGPHLISADHTGVPDALGGLGAGRALIDYMLADARANGFKIIPLCPYVRARYEKHPDWRDVMTVGPGEKPRIAGH